MITNGLRALYLRWSISCGGARAGVRVRGRVGTVQGAEALGRASGVKVPGTTAQGTPGKGHMGPGSRFQKQRQGSEA